MNEALKILSKRYGLPEDTILRAIKMLIKDNLEDDLKPRFNMKIEITEIKVSSGPTIVKGTIGLADITDPEVTFKIDFKSKLLFNFEGATTSLFSPDEGIQVLDVWQYLYKQLVKQIKNKGE